MKADRKYIIFIILVLLLFVIVEYDSPQPVNWEPTYSKNDKIPYGGYILYDYLSDIFPGKEVKESTIPVYNTLGDSVKEPSNYLFITSEFYTDTIDADKLLEYVSAGNNVFIAAESYRGPIADSLKIKTDFNMSVLHNSKDSVSLNFTRKEFHTARDFRYKKGTVDFYFINYDTTHTEILGENSMKQADYVKIRHGEGAFYLSSVPLAFTNYYAVNQNNAEYIFRALSCLPVADTWWDEYYKVNKPGGGSLLKYILTNAALQRAYYLLIFGVLLYILFEGKRRQRIIPVIQAQHNTSLEFVETIGLLYYQKGTHEDIAKKKIQYFFNYLRSKYNIVSKPGEDEYYYALGQMTGIGKEELRDIFSFIANVNTRPSIDDATLIKLNTTIDNFYKKTK